MLGGMGWLLARRTSWQGSETVDREEEKTQPTTDILSPEPSRVDPSGETDDLSELQHRLASSQQLRHARRAVYQEEEACGDPRPHTQKGNASVTTLPDPDIRKCEAGNVSCPAN